VGGSDASTREVVGLAEAEVAGRFGSKLRKKFLFLPPLELMAR
jgi:hypothetical protein